MAAAKPTGSLLQLWSLIMITVIGMILDPQASATAMATSDGSVIRLISNCTCIGYPLEFQCIAIGRGATIWRGSAFNCPSSLDKIQLYHSRFTTGTATGSCNNGNIIARALDTTEGRYRSQLNIHNLTPAMIGTTVECAYDNGTHVHSINNITISITTETFPPPVNITLDIVSKGKLLFSWNPVAPACTAIQYNINADKCGRCPTATVNSTSVVCTDVEVEDAEVCRFGVSTVACSGVIGMQNNLEIMLRVPNIISLSTIEVTPTYENTTSNLTKLTTGFNTIETNNMMQSTESDINVNSSIISYTVNYTDANTGKNCGNGTIPPTSCVNSACSHEFQVRLSKCPPEANFTVKMYGTNALGNGRNSDPIRRDFTNHLVKVVANPLRRMITCEFYHNSDSTKSCNATYFDEYCQSKLFTVNASNTGNSVNLDVHDRSVEHKRYCYIVAANNGTMEVNVSGFIIYQIDTDRKNIKATNDWIIAVSVFFPVIFVIAVTVFGILTTIFVHNRHSSGRSLYIMKRKNN